MKKTTKKIIAREFLILVFASVFYTATLLIWLIIVSRPNHPSERLTKLNRELESSYLSERKTPELNKPFNVLYERAKDNLGYKKDKYQYYTLLSKDSASLYQNYLYAKEKGYSKSIDQFRTLIQIDSSSINEYKEIVAENEKIKRANNEISETIKDNRQKSKELSNSFFNKPISFESASLYGLMLLIIFFPLRYIIYAVKWSVIQLKE